VVNNGVVLCHACAGEGYYHYSVDPLAMDLFDHVKES